MIRTLLATTAIAAVLALPVIAQDSSSSMESSALDSSMSSSEPMDASSSAPMDTSSSSMMSSEPMDASSSEVTTAEPSIPFDVVTGYTQIDSDRFATRIIGQPVYDGTSADANHLGDINDLVVDESGRIAAVIIGVGGFLGIGEKQVAVAYAALQWVVAEDDTERFVVETTVEDLTAAPDFVVVEDDPADGDAAPAAGDAMAPADPNAAAPADPNAMAPADTTSSAAQ